MSTSHHRYYSKMSINENEHDNVRHSIDYHDDMEAAQKKLEELRARKEALDAAKKKAEEIERQKAYFIEEQNYIGEQLYLASDKIEAEIESMRTEIAELEQIRNCFKRDLATLSGIQADSWPQDSVEHHLHKAEDILQHCTADYNDAVDHCMQMKHSKALTRTKRKKNTLLISFKEFFTQFQQGLAFHIPLVILLVIILVVHGCQNTP